MTKKTIAAQKYNVDNSQISADALYIIEKLQENGYEAYIVGGGIRDLLLGKEPKDFDIVTNATPEMVRKVFRRNSIIIGRRFKIVHVFFDNVNPNKLVNNRPILERHIIEVSTYRSNKVHKHTLSEHGRIMVDNNYGTQKEDVIRRDFTINALYYDPVAEKIIDYQNGLKDIENKCIKVIGKARTRYIEDPVRMLRAIRLSIKLGLSIDKDSLKPIEELKHLLLNESRGRMYEEMLKILLSGYSVECINALIKLDLPANTFSLLDRVFFKPKPDQLALNILAKTDLRLKENPDVSLVFILSGLLWTNIYTDYQELLTKGDSARQSFYDSISMQKDFAYYAGIAKNMFNNISDVWLLQLELEFPNIKRVDKILGSPRFRQAWHLYTSRHEVNQVDPIIYNWWNSYIEAENEEKIKLLEELADITLIGKITTKKKRKRSYTNR
ncbi:MAG: pcnB [Burkholderiales bacterium]|jgi:poly(A) polymerase|nr:pcnB [Burkholderiales bacterium]